MSLSRKLWASALLLAIGIASGARAETSILNETWNGTPSSLPLTIDSTTTTVTGDNSFNECYVGATSGTMQLESNSGDVSWNHTVANAAGTGQAGDALLEKTTGVTGVDIGTASATNTLLFQFDIQQNAAGDLLQTNGTADPGNRNVSAEVWGQIGGTGTRDGYSVRMKPTVGLATTPVNLGGPVTFQIGKISAVASNQFTLGSGPFVFTVSAATAMPSSATTLRFMMMVKPVTPGATTGLSNLTYRVINLTTGADFIAPGVGTMAFGPRATITTNSVAVRMRANALQRQDNIKIIANPNPILTISGANPYTVAAGSAYVDPGVTGIDATDRVLTTSSSPTAITNDSASSVNMNVLGSYTVTYTATSSVGNTGTTTRTVIVADLTAPQATSIVPTTTGPTNADSVDFTVTFSEDVQNFNDASDVVVNHSGTASTGVTITPITASSYTVSITGISGDGSFTLATNTASDVKDLANNALVAGVLSAPVSIDNTGPVASTITPVTTSPTNADSLAFTVAFDGAVLNFDAFSDLAVTTDGSAAVSGGTVTPSGVATYDVTLTGVTGDGNVALAVKTGAGVADASGNALASSVTSANVLVDNTAPVIALSTTAPATVGGAFTVNVDTGEATTSFDLSDVTTNNGSTGSLSGSGSTYTFSLTPTASPVTAKVLAGAYSDAAGNLNALDSNTISRNFDATLPSATLIVPTTTGPTKATSVDFDVTFDEPVQNFNDAADLVFTETGATHSGVSISGSGASYTVTVTGIGGNGGLALAVSTASDVKDLTNNPLSASVTSATVVIDNTGPSFSGLVVTPSEAYAGQSISIDFSSSETVTGDPQVTVNGHPATREAKAAYSYTYIVQETDPLGPAAISINGDDSAGNVGSFSGSAALSIIEAPAQLPLAAWPVVMAVAIAGSAALRRKK